jgi:hypothetical protein
MDTLSQLGFETPCCQPAAEDVQVVDIDYVNEAMKRMEKGDVHFRFVIDINKSLHL